MDTIRMMGVRAKLGGGSPNTITPVLAEWRALHAAKQATAMPPVPEPVEVVLRQVWARPGRRRRASLKGSVRP